MSVTVEMRTLLDGKNFSSSSNGQVAAHRVTGLIINRLWLTCAVVPACELDAREAGHLGHDDVPVGGARPTLLETRRHLPQVSVHCQHASRTPHSNGGILRAFSPIACDKDLLYRRQAVGLMNV